MRERSRRGLVLAVLLGSTAVLVATSPAPEWSDLQARAAGVVAFPEDVSEIRIPFEVDVSPELRDAARALTTEHRASWANGSNRGDQPTMELLGPDGRPCAPDSCTGGGEHVMVLRRPDDAARSIVRYELTVRPDGRGSPPGVPGPEVLLAGSYPQLDRLVEAGSGAEIARARWSVTLATTAALDVGSVPLLSNGVGSVGVSLVRDGRVEPLDPGSDDRLAPPEQCFSGRCTWTVELVRDHVEGEIGVWQVWGDPEVVSVAVAAMDQTDPDVYLSRTLRISASEQTPIDERDVVRIRLSDAVVQRARDEPGPLVQLSAAVVPGAATPGEPGAGESEVNNVPASATLSRVSPSDGATFFLGLGTQVDTRSGGVVLQPCPMSRVVELGECLLEVQLLRNGGTGAGRLTIDLTVAVPQPVTGPSLVDADLQVELVEAAPTP